MGKYSLILWACALIGAPVSASNLPGSMSEADVDRVIEIIGVAGTGRLLRSAEAYESFPGLKFGFEVLMVPGRNLATLGDGTGNISSVTPTPRIYLAKGLFLDLELILSVFPPSEVNTVSSFSGILKYTFFQEQATWLSGSFFLGVTKINAFSGNYTGTNVEVGMVLSRDYVRIKPFLGASALLVSGEVGTTFTTGRSSGSIATLHAFAGTEIELPLNFTVQLDLFNLALGASLFVGKKF